MNNNTLNQTHAPPHRPGKLRCLIKALLVILALIAGAGALWELALKDRLIARRWGVVESGLIYRSGRLPSSRIAAVLANQRIAVLIDLTENLPANQLQLQERVAAANLGIAYYNFPLRGDGTGDIAHYAQAIQVLHRARRAGQPVLIHCAAGAQRTGGVVAAYRVLVERRPHAEARAELQRYGWQPGKDQVLLDYLNANMAELAARLQTLQVIETVPNPLPRL
ncbi:MAG: dual specificity protein phosphatase family protein [Lentisphaerae bacterium]|nr:dual specificity protein phosphatase family protein [Lentisphaerota bacterium]